MIRPLLLALLVAAPATAQAPDRPPAFREAELAAVARLQRSTDATRGCTAVLITPQAALTAAHCARPNQPPILVFRPGTAGETMVEVASVHPHPDHIYEAQIPGRGRLAHDIAVLTLAAPLPAEVAVPMPLTAPDPDLPHAFFGFPIGSVRLLLGHELCDIRTDTAPILAFSCIAVSGQSGGALIRDLPDGPHLVAIAVAAINDPESPVRAIALVPDPATFPALAEALENAPTPPQSDRP